MNYLPFCLLIVVMLVALLFTVIGPRYFGAVEAPAAAAANYSNITMLGQVLYTNYAYPFEIAGVILLAAIIAAITLTFRGPVRRKVQNPEKQISVRREDAVRILKMPSEGKNT